VHRWAFDQDDREFVWSVRALARPWGKSSR